MCSFLLSRLAGPKGSFSGALYCTLRRQTLGCGCSCWQNAGRADVMTWVPSPALHKARSSGTHLSSRYAQEVQEQGQTLKSSLGAGERILPNKYLLTNPPNLSFPSSRRRKPPCSPPGHRRYSEALGWNLLLTALHLGKDVPSSPSPLMDLPPSP